MLEGIQERERVTEKRGRQREAKRRLASFRFACRRRLRSPSLPLNLDLHHHRNNNDEQTISARLASAAEEQPKSKQARALKLKKNKLKTKRVAGPVTVVALDAALASPSGATREFSFRCVFPLFRLCSEARGTHLALAFRASRVSGSSLKVESQERRNSPR